MKNRPISNSHSASMPQSNVPYITAIYCGGKPFTAIFFQIINQLHMALSMRVCCPEYPILYGSAIFSLALLDICMFFLMCG